MARKAHPRTLTIEACTAAARACVSFNLRKASRVATQVYDDALRPVRLRATQFVLLLAVRLLGATTMSGLAALVVSDPTTLSRNLKPLLRRNLVTRIVGADQRSRLVSLTPLGHQALSDAYPCWRVAQAEFVGMLGGRRFKSLLTGLDALVSRAGASKAAGPQPRRSSSA